MIISSLQNPRIKRVVRLRDRHDRDREQLLVIEGYRPIRRALDNHVTLLELFTCPTFFLGEHNEELIAQATAAHAEVLEVAPPVFQKMAYRERPEGLLAVAPQRHRPLSGWPATGRDFLLVAEAIEKPGNLGTMLRSADAAGVDALVVCDACTDVFNPNVVCASIGTLFSVPVLEATAADTVAWTHTNGIRLVAATPHGDALFTQTDLTGPLAIVMGTEQYGLTPVFMEAADVRVKIPMFGQADSLNVATATTLLLYEAVRQRRK